MQKPMQPNHPVPEQTTVSLGTVISWASANPTNPQSYDIRDQRVHASRLFASRPPPILPLSRTSVWLAFRSSLARCSREERSSASFVLNDLYRFTLELAPVR